MKEESTERQYDIEYWTVAKAAAHIGVDKSTLFRWIAGHRIAFETIPMKTNPDKTRVMIRADVAEKARLQRQETGRQKRRPKPPTTFQWFLSLFRRF